ncbi:MAG: zf-HC2 domain-containing protein [Acidobacteria bacterium]|nr:zf-HC2 domain-containing protein [Acidobacteriota bacterium]
MNCQECEEIISDYVDGALEPGAQTKIEHHLANCEACRAVRDDLLQIVHFSKQLPLHIPTSDLWSRIQTEIEAEQPKTWWARSKARLQNLYGRDFKFSIPQFAAIAAACIIVAAIGVVVWQKNNSQVPQFANAAPADNQLQTKLANDPSFQEFEQTIKQLKESVEQRKDTWGPELRLSFERNMTSIDQSLNDCRQLLSRNPNDETCKELLKNAYSEKVRVLQGFANF